MIERLFLVDECEIIQEEKLKRYFNEKIISLKNYYKEDGFFSMLLSFPRELVNDFYEVSGW